MLSIHQLTKQYPAARHASLQPVSFRLSEGQTMCVVGESGSGKTTLLRLVGGLLEPDAGYIRLNDEPVTGPAHNLVPGHPDIKMVFQDFALTPRLTVYDNVARSLIAYASDYRRARTQELLRRFLLTDLAQQYPATLSGGEKQRVALARALAEEPRLLLLDEPFSQIDASLKHQLIDELGDLLQETESAVLFVTHDARDALALSDQILVLQKGKMIQTGAPLQLYEQPMSPYVARLFGRCNLLSASAVSAFALPSVSGSVGIRPEHVHYTTKGDGVRATVERSTYQGGYYEVAVRMPDESRLLLYHPQMLKAGEVVFIKIEVDRIIRFEKSIG